MTHDIVVLGASAGGLEALRTIVRLLPRDFPAALLIVVHTLPADRDSVLDEILNRVSMLPVSAPVAGEPISRGQIYVAPPNHHLIVDGERMQLSKGPLHNGLRPSIDVLFRSAALDFGPRVIGVVLSGMLGDGSDGLLAIKNQGGIAVVQDPHEASFPDMPIAALRKVAPDHVAPIARIPGLLIDLTRSAATARARNPDPLLRFEVDADSGKVIQIEKIAKPSSFICPDCGGGLWKLGANGTRYRCEVGHSYSIDALGDNQKRDLERSLWAAIRTLEDRVKLSRELEGVWRDRGAENLADHFAEEANIAGEHSVRLRELLDVGSQ